MNYATIQALAKAEELRYASNQETFENLRRLVQDAKAPIISDICACQITTDGRSDVHTITDTNPDREFRFLDKKGHAVTVIERHFDNNQQDTIDVIDGHEWLFSRRDFRDNLEFSAKFIALIQ